VDPVDDAADFELLLSGLRAGDPAAIDTVCRRYGGFLRAAVRRQLHPRLRPRFDSVDVVQDVWLSFLNIPRERLQFDKEQDFVAYLGRVVYHRVVEMFRQRFDTQKYNVAREMSAEGVSTTTDWIAGSTATPSTYAVAGEEWEQLMLQFPEGHRAILRRLREGHDHRDIARMANVSLSTVNRVVRRLKEMTGA
jgi:RNA polymerase sigma-70 factor (ECF subfamily)